MASGTVKWYNPNKGYGFITPDENGTKDVFVHRSAVANSQLSVLDEGQKLNYDLEEGNNGKLSAVNLELIDE